MTISSEPGWLAGLLPRLISAATVSPERAPRYRSASCRDLSFESSPSRSPPSPRPLVSCHPAAVSAQTVWVRSAAVSRACVSLGSAALLTLSSCIFLSFLLFPGLLFCRRDSFSRRLLRRPVRVRRADNTRGNVALQDDRLRQFLESGALGICLCAGLARKSKALRCAVLHHSLPIDLVSILAGSRGAVGSLNGQRFLVRPELSSSIGKGLPQHW